MLKLQPHKPTVDSRGCLISLFLSMCLNILPLPLALKNINPDWLILTLIYWSILLPEKIGVFNAWLAGFWVDILTGRLLGQNALIYAIIIYTSLKLHNQLKQRLIPQQLFFVFFCLLFSQILRFWIENLQGKTELSLNIGWPAVLGTLLWPLFNLVSYYFFIRRSS